MNMSEGSSEQKTTDFLVIFHLPLKKRSVTTMTYQKVEWLDRSKRAINGK